MKQKSWALLLLAVLIFSGFFQNSWPGFISQTQAQGTGDYPPPETGEWIIDEDTYISDDNITASGNITITDTGRLILDNTVLVINASNYGDARISVEDGGELNIINNSRLMQGESKINYDFIFKYGSSGVISESTITDCGWDDGGSFLSTGGILTESDDVLIENSTFENNYIGVVMWASSPEIKNNIFRANTKYGLVLLNSSAEVTGNYISRSAIGVYSFYSEPEFSWNEIFDCGDGIKFYYSNVSFEGDLVTSNSPADCASGACSSQENGKGYYFYFSIANLETVTVSDNNNGLESYNSELYIANSSFSDNTGNGILGEDSQMDLSQTAFIGNYDYGILWRYSELDVDDSNSFIINTGKGRLRMEWEVRVNVTDDLGQRISIATVSVVDSDEISSVSKLTDPSGYAYHNIAQYEITNNGSQRDFNPYTITAAKAAPWDGMEYRNSTTVSVTENMLVNMIIPLKKPDLRADSIKVNGDAKVGKEMRIKVKVSNIGEAMARDVTLFVTQKDSAGKTVVVNSSVISIEPQTEKEISIYWTPEVAGEAQITLDVKTNYDELDKDNNEYELSVDIKEKDVPLLEQPYFLAILIAMAIILMGAGFYFLIFGRKRNRIDINEREVEKEEEK